MLTEWVSNLKTLGTTGPKPVWGQVIPDRDVGFTLYISLDFLSCSLRWPGPQCHISCGDTEAQRGQHPCPKLQGVGTG